MILLIVASISTLYFVIPAVSDAAEEPKTFLTHTGLAIQTTGDIIDPIGYTGEILEFDPESYLRDFDYGAVSELEDGTILREFTITARDDQVMEVSPGVFYNVWTFKWNCTRTNNSCNRG